MSNELSDYKAWLENRRLSPFTIKTYAYWHNRMLKEELGYQAFLERHRKPVVRAFLISLAKHQGVDIELEKVRRTPRHLPQYYPEGKEIAIQEAMKLEKYKVLLWLLSETGTRITEALNIKRDDIKPSETPPRIFIIGKGRKEAFIYPSSSLIDALLGLKEKEGNPYIFASPAKLGKPITTNAVRYQLKKIDPFSHPHKFRHTFAARQLSAGENLPTIKELLRHSDISTTAIYTQIDNREVQRAAKNTWKK